MTNNETQISTNSSFLRKTMKVAMWFLFIVILLLVILLIGFNIYLGSNKTKILDNLKFINNGVVTFNEGSISVFKNFPSATVSLNDVFIRDSSNLENPIIKVDQLNAALTISELLNKEVELNGVELKQGTLNLHTDKNGVNNLAKLFAPKKKNVTNQSQKFKFLTDVLNVSLQDFKIISIDESGI